MSLFYLYIFLVMIYLWPKTTFAGCNFATASGWLLRASWEKENIKIEGQPRWANPHLVECLKQNVKLLLCFFGAFAVNLAE